MAIELDGTAGAGAAGGHDQLIVNGTVNLDGGELSLILNYPVAEQTSFLILANDGSDPIVGIFAGLEEGEWFASTPGSHGNLFAITYVGGTGNDVVLTAVPEPASALLVMLAVPAVAARLRRRVRDRS